MSKNQQQQEVDDEEVEEEGFIATNRYKTKLCLKEEDNLQECVLKKRGLYGCERFMEVYANCKARETQQEIKDNRKRSEEEMKALQKKK